MFSKCLTIYEIPPTEKFGDRQVVDGLDITDVNLDDINHFHQSKEQFR